MIVLSFTGNNGQIIVQKNEEWYLIKFLSKLTIMTINFSMNCSDANQRTGLSLLRNLLDKLEKSVGSNHFNQVELSLYEKYEDAAKNGKMAVVKISSDDECFMGDSLSKNWYDAMLNAFDFVQQKIEAKIAKPIIAIV